jgi:hypothetical protein
MKKKVLIGIGVVFLLVVACTAALVGGVMGATQPLADSGERFMTALKDGDYRKAYEMASPGLQKELQDPAGLERIVKGGNVQPATWSFSSRNISGDQGELKGTTTLTGGRPGEVAVVLGKVGSDWKITGFRIRER